MAESTTARVVPVSGRTMNGPEWLLLLALSGLWGSSFFFFKILGQALPPLTIVLGRVGLAAVVLNLVLVGRGQRLTRHMPWGRFVVLGLLNSVVPFTLFAWGETHVSSGMAAMLNATTPLFAVVLTHLAGTERLTLLRAVGVLFGLLGVAVLVGVGALRHAGANLAGDGACLLASFSYGLGGLYMRRLRHLPALQIATGQLTAGALALLPVAALVDRFWMLPAPAATTWAALAGIALLCTALAYAVFFRLVATAGATNAMLVTFLLPISALILGRVFLGEPVPLRALAGMALIGTGLAAIDGQLLRRRSVLFPHMRLP